MQPVDKHTHGRPHCSQASMRALKPGLCSASVRVDACGDASIASRLTPGDCCRRHCALAPPGDALLRPGTRSRPSVAGVRGVALLGLRLGLGRLAPAVRAAPREGVSAGAWSWRGVHDVGAFAAAAGDACSNLRLDAFMTQSNITFSTLFVTVLLPTNTSCALHVAPPARSGCRQTKEIKAISTPSCSNRNGDQMHQCTRGAAPGQYAAGAGAAAGLAILAVAEAVARRGQERRRRGDRRPQTPTSSPFHGSRESHNVTVKK